MLTRVLLLFNLLMIILTLNLNGQVYDVLITETFDNTTSITAVGATGFNNGGYSGTCGNNNVFETTSNANLLGCVYYESGSVFACVDKDAANVGTANPMAIVLLTYTATDNDHISFVGDFAALANCAATSSDVVTVYYSTDNGSTWTAGLVLTGGGPSEGTPSNTINYLVTGNSFTCSDGTSPVHADMVTKEIPIGNNLSGLTLKIKVEFNGLTSAQEGIILDNFRFVKTRNILASENFDNTASMTSTDAFTIAAESATCGINSMFDVTANMATPSKATNCTLAEDGSFFVMTKRPAGITSPQELVMLTYTATNGNEISFRGNFATFADDQNSDNNIVVAYSTDNGSTYTDALTLTGIDLGTDFHSCSDGTSPVGLQFITKGFSIGSGLNGQTIKIKVTFTNYSNGGDGIALDKFRLEGSLNSLTLPIKLIKFNAKIVEDATILNWATSSEINNDYFIVERSLDTRNWEFVEKVKGAGTSSRKHEYSVKDDQNIKGKVYYRLKQTDYDGHYTYSRIASVNNIDKEVQNTNFNVYPNPISKYSSLNIDGKIVALRLYSLLGELILEKRYVGNENNVTLNMLERNDLRSGTYILYLEGVENSIFQIHKLVMTE